MEFESSMLFLLSVEIRFQIEVNITSTCIFLNYVLLDFHTSV